MRQYWSIPHTVETWLRLIFTYYLNWNQHRRDGAIVLLLTSLRMQRKSWKGFRKMDSRNVSDIVYSCTRGLFCRKFSLNDFTLLYFSEITWFREHFDATAYKIYGRKMFKENWNITLRAKKAVPVCNRTCCGVAYCLLPAVFPVWRRSNGRT
jgi:hypothetical protein